MSGASRRGRPGRAPTPGRAPGGASGGRLAWAGGALAAVLASLVVAPDRWGLHGVAPFAQAVALRAPVALGLALAAGLLLALPWRRRLGPAAVVLAVGALASGAVLADRGVVAVATPTDRPEVRPDGAVVVLVLNTQDALTGDDVAGLVLARGADVVVLPETWVSVGEEVAALAAAEGRRLQVLGDDGDGWSATGATTLLVDERLGDYDVVAHHPGRLSSFTAAPAAGDGPTAAAVPPHPPLPGTMADWAAETVAAARLCETRAADVVAGDLNATADHPALRGLDRCVDAATVSGVGGVGTWPTTAPAWLGAPIDHVLVDDARWTVVSTTVLRPPTGTDHRALEAVLVRVPSG